VAQGREVTQTGSPSIFSSGFVQMLDGMSVIQELAVSSGYTGSINRSLQPVRRPCARQKKAFKLPVPGSQIFVVFGRHFSTNEDASVYNYEPTMRSSLGAFDRYRLTAWYQWVVAHD